MNLIVGLLILLVVIIIVNLILDQLTLPPNIKYVVLLIVGLLFLIVLLNRLGLMGAFNV